MSHTILSADDVRAIADLARLQLGEDDVPRYQQQLSAILGYFQKLEELDTSPYGSNLISLALDQCHACRSSVPGTADRRGGSQRARQRWRTIPRARCA